MTEPDTETALIAAAFTLAAEKGWRCVSIADAARHADIPLAVARAKMPSRHALLLHFGRLADAAALADAPTEGSPRDRLFDLLMRRIDALQAHRAGVLAMLDSLKTDPATALMLSLATRSSMRWMLDAAGIPRGGSLGPLSDTLRVKGLVAVWLWTIRAWCRDDSLDLSATMAALDVALTRAESAASWLTGRNDRPLATPDDDASFIEPPATPAPEPV
jgi:ubiquinone biosynthesis protein COQ9